MPAKKKKKSTKKASPFKFKEITLKKGEIVEITKDMIIGDVILAYPIAGEIMRKMGIHCIGCHGAAYESIEEGALIHGLNPEEICKIINEAIKKTPIKKKKSGKK